MVRKFFSDWKTWDLSVAIWNFRWDLGYKIGGFTSARRSRR